MGNRPLFSANPLLGTCPHSSNKKGIEQKTNCYFNSFTKKWEISSSNTTTGWRVPALGSTKV